MKNTIQEVIGESTVLTKEMVKAILNSPTYNKKKVTLIIPDYVKEIDSYAFYECIGLKEIKIPKEIIHIGKRAFKGCENLVLIVEEGSSAHIYAKNNKVKFILRSGERDSFDEWYTSFREVAEYFNFYFGVKKQR